MPACLQILCKVVGSFVAVLGICVSAMVMPIMVSNFNMLYINAIVGRPGALKKIHDKLDHDVEARM
jgi:hypothetical protein